MNEEADEDLTYEVSDEALETAATNEAQSAWTMLCTGKRCLHSLPLKPTGQSGHIEDAHRNRLSSKSFWVQSGGSAVLVRHDIFVLGNT
jgi:hypothetical protein